MKNELLDLIQSKSPGSQPLLLVVRGSHAYGTNIESSDFDYSGVFIQNLDSKDSDLPDSVDMGFVEDLLISIRKNFYKL